MNDIAFPDQDVAFPKQDVINEAIRGALELIASKTGDSSVALDIRAKAATLATGSSLEKAEVRVRALTLLAGGGWLVRPL